MKLFIDLDEDGSFTVITKEGTFEGGIPLTAQIGAALAMQARVEAEAGEPEQHIHTEEQLGVHQHNHEEAGHAR